MINVAVIHNKRNIFYIPNYLSFHIPHYNVHTIIVIHLCRLVKGMLFYVIKNLEMTLNLFSCNIYLKALDTKCNLCFFLFLNCSKGGFFKNLSLPIPVYIVYFLGCQELPYLVTLCWSTTVNVIR